VAEAAIIAVTTRYEGTMGMSSDVEREVLSLLRELRSEHGLGQKDVLEAISRLDKKITRLHADMMEITSEMGRLHAELSKTGIQSKGARADSMETRKDRRRSTRLH